MAATSHGNLADDLVIVFVKLGRQLIHWSRTIVSNGARDGPQGQRAVAKPYNQSARCSNLAVQRFFERCHESNDDAKRLERDNPEAMAKIRERTGAGENDLLILAAWGGEPKGHRPEETVYQACGQLRLIRV